MEALGAMMQRLGGTDPRLAEEIRRQREETRRKDEENRLRSHYGAAGRPTGDACLIEHPEDVMRGYFLGSTSGARELHP